MGILWEHSFLVFLFMTLIIGGGAAWLTGRAIAITWRPTWMLVTYSFLLACAVRFLHFALFEGSLLSVQFFIVDFVCLFVTALLGWRVKRVQQMATQYPWLYEKTGPFTWTERS